MYDMQLPRGVIVLLNSASFAGKTRTARLIQHSFEEPYLCLGANPGPDREPPLPTSSSTG